MIVITLTGTTQSKKERHQNKSVLSPSNSSNTISKASNIFNLSSTIREIHTLPNHSHPFFTSTSLSLTQQQHPIKNHPISHIHIIIKPFTSQTQTHTHTHTLSSSLTLLRDISQTLSHGFSHRTHHPLSSPHHHFFFHLPHSLFNPPPLSHFLFHFSALHKPSSPWFLRRWPSLISQSGLQSPIIWWQRSEGRCVYGQEECWRLDFRGLEGEEGVCESWLECASQWQPGDHWWYKDQGCYTNYQAFDSEWGKSHSFQPFGTWVLEILRFWSYCGTLMVHCDCGYLNNVLGN